MIRSLLIAATSACALAFVVSCGEDDGKTPNCPALELYDIRKFPDIPPSAIEARNAAAAKGCVTNPGDAATSGDGGNGGAGGTSTTGGAAGAGGSAGATAGAGGT